MVCQWASMGHPQVISTTPPAVTSPVISSGSPTVALAVPEEGDLSPEKPASFSPPLAAAAVGGSTEAQQGAPRSYGRANYLEILRKEAVRSFLPLGSVGFLRN